MDDIRAIFKATADEQSKGLAGIMSVSAAEARFGRGGYRSDERFLVKQPDKDRPCENCKLSLKNRVWLTHERVSFAPADSAAAVGRFFIQAAERLGWAPERRQVGGSVDDEPNAYRNSAARRQAETTFMIIDPSVDPRAQGPCGQTTSVRVAVPRGLNFGLAAAVPQYCRESAFITTLLRRLLLTPVVNYVDDYQVPEPRFAVGTRTSPRRWARAGSRARARQCCGLPMTSAASARSRPRSCTRGRLRPFSWVLKRTSRRWWSTA